MGLKGLKITHPNQAWASDITYLKINGGYIYLVAIIDIYSRKALTWRISNTLDNRFCKEVLEEALVKYGKPDIFNTDQGSQFTSNDFLSILENNDIRISMDGKGRALDNVYIERLWRSLKYEEIYLKEYEEISECIDSVNKYFTFYNTERFHQSLEYETPDDIYYQNIELKKVS